VSSCHAYSRSRSSKGSARAMSPRTVMLHPYAARTSRTNDVPRVEARIERARSRGISPWEAAPSAATRPVMSATSGWSAMNARMRAK